eukprot:CAMPEP_0114297794 /NCGR_PEP_ID=MMETSP0059-20121206/12055_1 /TAXON_ID=36894 /ORGANISM="Pyramimonas parkeae, Strain CCMP726" /LENGTH=142 /DNA_ID=CAMNT_0001420073 /DNA_START=144 /DNA_END=572 /DNA_ORIENTATION=+
MLLNSLRGREGGGGGGLDFAFLEAWLMGSTSESAMNKVARRVHLTCLQLHAALHAPLFEKHSHCDVMHLAFREQEQQPSHSTNSMRSKMLAAQLLLLQGSGLLGCFSVFVSTCILNIHSSPWHYEHHMSNWAYSISKADAPD